MGLGKTLQTISMLARIYPEQKESSLIVMPRSLIFNWQAELKRFAPQLTVYTFYGPTRDLEEARKHHLILTTYAMVRNNVELFKDAHFHYVVLDESQNIKNVTAQSTQAVYLLKADHRLALSGTPIENNLTELYSLFRFQRHLHHADPETGRCRNHGCLAPQNFPLHAPPLEEGCAQRTSRPH